MTGHLTSTTLKKYNQGLLKKSEMSQVQGVSSKGRHNEEYGLWLTKNKSVRKPQGRFPPNCTKIPCT